MKPLRIGIVGAGGIAEKHLEVLKTLPSTTLAGICSRTRAKAEKLAQAHGIRAVAQDLDALMRKCEPEALLILVSAASVYPVAQDALRLGVPIFIEKPAGLSPEETGRLAAQAKVKNVPNMVGYNRRFYSVFHQGIDLLRGKGALLGIAVEGHERIAAARLAGTHPQQVLDAWLYANATHTIDLLRFFGGEIAETRPFAARASEPLADQIAAALRFRNGALGTYQAHWQSPAGWRASLYGEGVAIEFKPLETGRWAGTDGKSGELTPSAEDQRFKPGFHGQTQAFCALARGGRLTWPAIDLEGAHQTMLLAETLVKDAGAR
jgi:predicted dehydrogenase